MKYYEERFRATRERKFSFYLLHPFFHRRRNGQLVLTSVLRCRSQKPVCLSDFSLKIGDVPHKCRIITPFYKLTEKRCVHTALIRIVIDPDEMTAFAKHSVVSLCLKSKNSIAFNGFRKSYTRIHSPAIRSRDGELIGYFRQSISNKLMLTVRTATEADQSRHRLKILSAYLLASVRRLFEKKRPVLMNEKLGRYEEGASILYEKLIDEGYKKVYFTGKSALLPKDLPAKYRAHILEPLSFKHFYIYFRTDAVVSSEQASYTVDFFSPSFLIWRHYRRGYNTSTHVHLQHGVSYMISLSSATRSGSRRTSKADHYREVYVVCSEKEANHLKEGGNYLDSELYMTGLPKFDRAYLKPGADRIIVMPTWRPWEENAANSENPENTTYYAFIRRIVNAVPEELKEKVVVLPHPAFNRALKTGRFETPPMSYDELLRETKLLITDYSSISYDAFYRGANVVFDWSELAYCMEQYGANSHLMLTEEDAFGDVCYTEEELRASIKEAYYGSQKQEYIDNYHTIVSFHDGHNCDRVIECLKKDGIL